MATQLGACMALSQILHRSVQEREVTVDELGAPCDPCPLESNRMTVVSLHSRYRYLPLHHAIDIMTIAAGLTTKTGFSHATQKYALDSHLDKRH